MKKWQLSRLLNSISFKLKSSFGNRPSSTSRRRPRTRQFAPVVQTLQTRELLSATLGYTQFIERPDFDFPVGTGTTPPPTSGGINAPIPITEVPAYSSLPNADLTIYLDFNGHITTNTQWNIEFNNPTITSPAYSLDNDFTTFSDSEQLDIYRIWQQVSEDFIPFNINVTTVDPGIEGLRKTGAGDTQYGIRIVMTEDTENSGAGGIAYINSFSWSSDTPVWGYNKGGAVAADTISHEVGHSLGLAHDGRIGEDGGEYYGGHGTGDTSWAPIMGAFFVDGTDENVSQWDNGYYSLHTNTGGSANYGAGAGDLEVITGSLHGVTYRTDDHGNTIPTATTLDDQASGIIERNTDVDYFMYEHTGGTLTLSATPFLTGPNLDIQLRLFTENGTLIAIINQADLLTANYAESISAGTYFIEVDGVGAGDPTSATPTGYNDYGSLGRYTLSAVSEFTVDFYDAYEIAPPDVDLNAGDAGVSEILQNVDDDTYQIILGGVFQYADTQYTSLYVSSNGVISFGNGLPDYENADLNDFAGGIDLIVPYWDDFVTNVNGSDSVLYSFRDVIGDSTPDLVIEWNVYHIGSTSQMGTFQAILELGSTGEASDMVFNYVNTYFGTDSYDDGASATIGLYKDGMSYTQFGYNTLGMISSGRAILYTMRGDVDSDDQITEAITLPIDGGVTYNGRIDNNVDVDMYQFTATAGQVLAFSTLPINGSNLDPLIRLFDVDGNELALFDDGPEFDGTSGTFTILEDGTYYIGVSAYPNLSYNPVFGGSDAATVTTGEYTVSIVFSDPDDQISEALTLKNGTTGAIDFSGDVDIYKYAVLAGQVLTFTLKPTGATWNSVLRLFNASGTQLAIDDNANGSVSITYSFTKSGTYYLGVSGSANTAYNPITGLKDTSVTAKGQYSIQIATANAAPTGLALSSTVIAENKNVGTNVGIFTATDSDPGNTFTYTLVSGTGSTNNASFAIAGNTLRTIATFDYETKTSYSIRVRVTDQGGLYYEKVFTISVADVIEPLGSTALNNLRYGVATVDNATGGGYLMYSQQNVHTRFGGLNTNNSENFISVRFQSGQWQYNNDSTWINFTTVATDRLVAEVNFSTDVISLLKGKFGFVQGITKGYLDSDLVVAANRWNNLVDNGEFAITGTYITFGTVSPVTNLASAVMGTDSATGTGYMMFSQESVFTRFANIASTNATNLINVRYFNGSWQYDNDKTWVNFIPLSSDRLIAELNFSTDTVVMLKNNFGFVNGIMRGYVESDIVISPNVLSNGKADAGEFGVRGTYIVYPPQTSLTYLRSGVLGSDNATGTGYMMFSQENVHTRFTNINASNSDHLVNVRYSNGSWQYDNDLAWVNFTPRATDALIAELNFTTDTVSRLKGKFSPVQGISKGYLDSDIVIKANTWAGVANPGEYTVTGTFITFIPQTQPQQTGISTSTLISRSAPIPTNAPINSYEVIVLQEPVAPVVTKPLTKAQERRLARKAK